MSEPKPFTGNAGEWGEAFVVLHLLSHSDLHNADAHGERIENEVSRVRAIYRTESSGRDVALMLFDGTTDSMDDPQVMVFIDGEPVRHIPVSRIADAAHSLFGKIADGQHGPHPDEEALLRELGLETLGAPASRKADLRARVSDGFIGSLVTRNYSIKTLIKGEPSLSNASGGSYIDYELPGFDRNKAEEVNSISGNAWVVNRIRRVLDLTESAPIPSIANRTFERNLLKCHWRAPESVGYAVLYGNTISGKRLPDAIGMVSEVNPAGWAADEIEDYEDAVRKYLWAIVFDMTPAVRWAGPSQVDGYLLAKRNEEVLAYQVSRQRSFENYLLAHSSFDTPSTSRGSNIGKVFEKDGRWFFRLSCVVKYKTKEYSGENVLAHSSFDTPSTSRGSNIGKVFEKDGRWFFRLSCVVKYKTKEYSGENAGMLEFE